jgi:hypothetical protein
MGFNNIGYLEKDKQAADSAKLQGKQIGTNFGDVADVSSNQTLSNKKISFQNSADASPTVLDWYEDGTFTPTVQGGTTLGTGTYSTQKGRYTRIGNKVFFDITVKVSAHNGTGQLQIAGLPFVSNAAQESSVSISYMSMLSFAYIPLAHVYPNSATVRLLRTVANSTPVYLVFSDITGYPFELRISGHYTAA